MVRVRLARVRNVSRHSRLEIRDAQHSGACLRVIQVPGDSLAC